MIVQAVQRNRAIYRRVLAEYLKLELTVHLMPDLAISFLGKVYTLRLDGIPKPPTYGSADPPLPVSSLSVLLILRCFENVDGWGAEACDFKQQIVCDRCLALSNSKAASIRETLPSGRC